jgi:hypothetical protein
VIVQPVIEFSGRVEARRKDCGPLHLVLSGRTVQQPQELVHLSFAGTAPADLPDTLENATIERVGPGHFTIASGARRWTVNARAAHVHREVAAAFYRAIPPQPVRWTQRLFWRIVLALAATRPGRALVRKARGA